MIHKIKTELKSDRPFFDNHIGEIYPEDVTICGECGSKMIHTWNPTEGHTWFCSPCKRKVVSFTLNGGLR